MAIPGGLLVKSGAKLAIKGAIKASKYLKEPAKAIAREAKKKATEAVDKAWGFAKGLFGGGKKSGTVHFKGKGNPVPTKAGGGSDPNNFVNEHAKKHMYDSKRPSTPNRSQYGEDVDVRQLRQDTMNNPDKAYSNWPGNPNNPNKQRITKYYKEYDGNISTPDTPTGSHRVFNNLDNPRSSSHFPYVPRN
ncbi:hypothetical protein [Paenibacillus prosopidis]|nr:hypothetical protein [Paenibacillus prosopidis]